MDDLPAVEKRLLKLHHGCIGGSNVNEISSTIEFVLNELRRKRGIAFDHLL